MHAEPDIKPKWRELSRAYHAALQRYIKNGAATGLKPALCLGRRAVALGMETLDIALSHEQALLVHVLPNTGVSDRDRIVRIAGRFFAEAILPLEKGHRAARATNALLRRMNRTLNRRTRELAASNRQMKTEIVRRRAVERALRQSERQSNRLLEQSRRLQEELRILSRRVLSLQEEERRRISRELHDVVAQMLTSINVRLALLKTAAAVNTKGLSRKISRTQKLVERSVDIVHRFAHDLRPAMLDHLGLIPALHVLGKSFAKENGVRVNLTAHEGVKRLDAARRTVLYRVAQEALINIARHAKAGRVDIAIQKLPTAIRMRIWDDGKSFDVDQALQAGKTNRIGLLGMRERVEMVGGRFAITSAPGHGTTVQADLPSPRGARRSRRS